MVRVFDIRKSWLMEVHAILVTALQRIARNERKKFIQRRSSCILWQQNWSWMLGQHEKWRHIFGKDGICKIFYQVRFEFGARNRCPFVLNISEEAAYDRLGVQLGDLLEGDGEIKEIATLLSLIERAQLGA